MSGMHFSTKTFTRYKPGIIVRNSVAGGGVGATEGLSMLIAHTPAMLGIEIVASSDSKVCTVSPL